MRKRETPRLALCPIGKFVFSHEDALRQKRALREALDLWNVDHLDLEGVIPDGIVREQAHVDPVVEHFRRADVDALFLPHCNFGTEGAAAMIARRLGLPTLLWGPRDEAPKADGTRLRDSLCGMFATSKVLRRLSVPFTYVENCRLDDPPFREGLDRFLRAANVGRLFREGMRIGQVGQRIDFFWTTIVDEGDLLDRFGIEVLPLDLVDCIRQVRERAKSHGDAYRLEAEAWKERIRFEGYDDDTPLVRMLALRDQLLDYVRENDLDALAVQDFPSMVDALGSYDFFAITLVAEQIPVGIESDIHGAVSGAMLRRALLGRQPVFLADVTMRHPVDDDGVLLWHAGAPLSMAHPKAAPRVGHHWILPSPLSGMPHFRLREGPITVARFDGDGEGYKLAVGEGESCNGPETLNNWVWIHVDDWARWERALIEGPFIHHVAMGYEHVGEALVEACRYIPGLTPVRLGEGHG